VIYFSLFARKIILHCRFTLANQIRNLNFKNSRACGKGIERCLSLRAALLNRFLRGGYAYKTQVWLAAYSKLVIPMPERATYSVNLQVEDLYNLDTYRIIKPWDLLLRLIDRMEKEVITAVTLCVCVCVYGGG